MSTVLATFSDKSQNECNPSTSTKKVVMILDLNGQEWSVREALGLTWQWYLNAPLPVTGNNVADAAEAAAAAPGWLSSRVPGSVIDDLLRAGEIPDIRVARQSRAAEWVAERSWVYRRPVELPAFRSGAGVAGAGVVGERVVLELDGVDPGGVVFWDGVPIGQVDGLYHRARIDLTAAVPDRLSPGRHVLALVVHPAPDSEPQVGRTELVRVHSPRMNYGWDFSPRMCHQGIWRSARIVIGAVQFAAVTARAELSPDLAQGIVSVAATIEAAGPVRLFAKLRMNGVVVAESATVARGSGATLRLELAHPEFWWPNGYGEQALYELQVAATGDDGEAVCTRKVGFRRVEFRANAGAEASALPYTAVVNGIPVPLTGWNWVPADTLYGAVPAGRIEHLIGLAAASGARILRVWGGGLIEGEEFYDACDRAGLMVWQEFSQSSSGMQSAPATDEAFVGYLRAEAEAIVPTLTHHPSLIIWGGGNELADETGPLDDDRSPVLAVLHRVVGELDPGRAWLPTSPTGPEFANRLDRIRADPAAQHDVHGPWEHQGLEAQHTLYNAGTSLAHTEFGVEGMTNLRSLEALIPQEQRWPADKTNAVYRHLGEWWNNAPLVQELFGGRLDTVERMQRASQLLQAMGLQYAVEADRRRWPHCSMVIPWQLNESFPSAWCTSSVDYRGDAKPAYHAVSRAFRAERVTIRVERSAWAGHRSASAEAWLWSDRGMPAGSSVTLRARDIQGAVLAEKALPAGAVREPQPLGSLEFPLASVPGTIFLWEAEWRSNGVFIDSEVVVASTTAELSGLLDLTQASLQITAERDGDERDGAERWLVTAAHVGGPVVVGLELVDARPITAPGWAVIDGDPRPLLPGQSRRFLVRWHDGQTGQVARNRDPEGRDPGSCDPGSRDLAIRSWNTAEQNLTAEPGGSPRKAHR